MLLANLIIYALKLRKFYDESRTEALLFRGSYRSYYEKNNKNIGVYKEGLK